MELSKKVQNSESTRQEQKLEVSMKNALLGGQTSNYLGICILSSVYRGGNLE